MEQANRVVVLIDMDCFYCQVEEKLDPELKGKPIAVVQYNPWKGGGIIAVNYEARSMGVTRNMRGDEAKQKCPDIQLPSVPCSRGKADITKYRDAGKEVARVLQKFTPLLERASIDEAYLDITAVVQKRLKDLNVNSINTEMIPNTFALGYDGIEEFISDVQGCGSESIEFDHDHAKDLLVGAVVVSEIRAAVYEETGYRCSAGISHNKILAKLVCGMNKPNKQTVLPKHSINILYKTLSVKKVKHLGGKFGDTVCDILKISKMGELQRFSEKELQTRFDEKNGTWLYNIARGIDLEPVQARFNPKSIGCCKQFRGKSALVDLDSLRKWLKDLGDEIEDRLEKDAVENNRTPKQMVVSFSTQGPDGRDQSNSRSYNFVADDELRGEMFSAKALELVLESAEGAKPIDEESNRKLKAPIKFLGISVGKFEENSELRKTKKIVDYFTAGSTNANKINDNAKHNVAKKDSSNKSKMNAGKEYIMQKFLQVGDKNKIPETNNIEQTTGNDNKLNIDTKAPLETPLEKQESFFNRFLNGKKTNSGVTKCTETEKAAIRSTTPVCNVVSCGEDSVDTEYSGSTINMEINKSIALFDNDAQDVTRVSNMRELLNNSNVVQDKSRSITPEMPPQSAFTEAEPINEPIDATERNRQEDQPGVWKQDAETFDCTECGKAFSYDMFETHADYHLALKIREEERQRVRDEHKHKSKPQTTSIKETKRKKPMEEQSKNETVVPISNFFEKLNDSTPTEKCSECNKRVAVEKFAEHLDFHEAQKLSRELNRKPTTAPSYLMGNSVKRKRKSISPVKKLKLPCNSRSIDSFFR